MRQRKIMQADQRTLELQLASMGMSTEREVS